MTDKELLVEAYLTGHAWNPAYPSLANLDLASVQKMDGTERDAKDLIASRQASDINMDRLVAAYHAGRQPEFDGEIGPATRALATIPRCAMPDFAPPPHASFHYDDPELQAAVESMQAAAFKSDYWPGCDPDRSDVHSLVIGIDITRAPKNWLANQDKILEARRKMAAGIGVAVRFVINPKSMSGLQQYQVFKPIPGGVIGYNYFPGGGCGKIPNGSLDTGYDPSDWRLHACLGSHESEGHGFGFNHTRGGNMNASIVLVDPLTWVGDPAWPQVVRYYPAKPLELPTPDPTDPPGEPTPGSAVVWEGQLAAGTYQLIRKGGGLPPIQV